MTRPDPQSEIPTANMPDRALSDRLRALLDHCADLIIDPEALARRLAPLLADAGIVIANSALAPSSAPAPAGDAIEQRLFEAVSRHPAGQSQGIAPDMLAQLTGVSGAALAQAVSSLVQKGQLIRDGWLVRLPEPGDLLPQMLHAGRGEHMTAAVPERRTVGDRRAVGERRLYDRRGPRD